MWNSSRMFFMWFIQQWRASKCSASQDWRLTLSDNSAGILVAPPSSSFKICASTRLVFFASPSPLASISAHSSFTFRSLNGFKSCFASFLFLPNNTCCYWLSYVKFAIFCPLMDAFLKLFIWLHHRHKNFYPLLLPHSSAYPESWKINQNLLLQEAREMIKTHEGIIIFIINFT